MKVHGMKEKIRSFMTGRYGFDELSKCYLTVTIILMVLSLFIRNRILYWAALALLVYSYYRAFSKNLEKRRQENQKYCSLRYRFVVKWDAFLKRQASKRIYRFYRCPKCRQKVRVPKGKGKICITCPKCKEEFIKKS